MNLTGQTLVALTVAGTPFVYDPAGGNLLLDIRSSISASGRAFFDARIGDADGLFSRAHNFGSGFTGYGLVTQFNTSTVPEPGSIALVGTGLLALLGMGAPRRQAQS